MKNFIRILLATFAIVPSLQAIPSNLGESLLEYEAILNSPLLQTTLSQSEFITDIERKTKKIIFTTGTVIYVIRTMQPITTTGSGSSRFLEEEEFSIEGEEFSLDDEEVLANYDAATADEAEKLAGSRKHSRERTYLAKLLLTPNPQIGPPVITVVSIKRI